MRMSSRTSEASVGALWAIYSPLLQAGYDDVKEDPDTRSLRSLLRDDN
jgi:hypothetical protein